MHKKPQTLEESRQKTLQGVRRKWKVVFNFQADYNRNSFKMSGGAFDYNQYKIRQIWEDIQQELDKQGKEKSKEDLRYYDEKYPEERFYAVYPEEVQKIFRDGVEALKIAEIYTQRIDWYLSGDDGEDNLIKRLKEELDE